MSIRKHLPPQARRELKKVGWSKSIELAKIARRDRQDFDCATWLHKARELPKEEFKQEVAGELKSRLQSQEIQQLELQISRKAEEQPKFALKTA